MLVSLTHEQWQIYVYYIIHLFTITPLYLTINLSMILL